MNIYIVAASDTEQDEERRLRWGDYWFKKNLSEAFQELGHEVVEAADDADMLVNCHGFRLEMVPEHTYNVLWIIGHPAAITENECWQYDQVYAESEEFTEHVREWGIHCKHLPGASDFVPMDLPKEHEIVFVGNIRWDGSSMRPSISALGPLEKYVGKLEVWGEGWENLPEGIWQGLYYPNEELNKLYASSKVVLNDTHPDMVEWGMHNPRYYDMKAVQGEEVPTFRDCAKQIVRDMPTERIMLDLGCGEKSRRNMLGVDSGVEIGEFPGVWSADLEEGIPNHTGWYDFRVIVADNLLEHIHNLIPLMNDCHSHLLKAGRMHIRVPSVRTSAAFEDPTHVRYFAPGTFDYFNFQHPRWENYGRRYGIQPWRIVYLKEEGRFIDVMMRPVEVPQKTILNQMVEAELETNLHLEKEALCES